MFDNETDYMCELILEKPKNVDEHSYEDLLRRIRYAISRYVVYPEWLLNLIRPETLDKYRKLEKRTILQPGISKQISPAMRGHGNLGRQHATIGGPYWCSIHFEESRKYGERYRALVDAYNMTATRPLVEITPQPFANFRDYVLYESLWKKLFPEISLSVFATRNEASETMLRRTVRRVLFGNEVFLPTDMVVCGMDEVTPAFVACDYVTEHGDCLIYRRSTNDEHFLTLQDAMGSFGITDPSRYLLVTLDTL